MSFDPHDIDMLLGQFEPAAHALYGRFSTDALAQYSIAISMKRLADFFAAFEARIEASIAMDGKSNGSEH